MKQKNKKNALRDTMTGFVLMLAVSLWLTGCSTSKKLTEAPANNVTDVAGTPESEPQLQDDCALLHVYRKSSMAGAAVGYDVSMDSEKVYRAKNKSKTTIKLTKAGTITLWAKTETKVELPVNIELGHEYYIRCGIKMGALVGRPKLEIVDSNTGKSEFINIPVSKK